MPALCSVALLTAATAFSAPVFVSPVFAQEQGLYDIDIASGPFVDTFVALAMQTGISIGGTDPARCGEASRPIKGRIKPEQALRAMLAGSRCELRRFDSRTFRIDFKSESRRNPIFRLSTPRLPEPDEGEVLVTRSPLQTAGTPRAVSIVSRDVVAQNDFDLTRLAARVPGMAVTNLGPGRNKILLRGVSDSILTGRTQSTVGLYLDDSAITYNAPDPDLLLIDMARVEVLKGPQGALYGQGSLSGVVRLVTNKPLVNAFDADIGAGLGLTEGGETSWRVTGMVNLPLQDRIAVRAIVYEDQSGGFIRDNTNGRKTTNATTRSGGRLAASWLISERMIASASLVGQNLNSENSQYVLSEARPFRRELALAEPHDNRFTNLSAGLQGEFTQGTLKVAVNHLNHDISSGYDAQTLRSQVSVVNSGVLFYDEKQSMELTTGEVSFLSPSSNRLRWLAGLFFARSEEHFDPHLSDVYTQMGLYDEARIDRIDDLALFGQLIYDVTPRWTASLGLRGTRSHHETDSQIENVNLTGYTPSAHFLGKIDASRVAHSLVVNYRHNANLVFYAQTADGFRTGGFNTTTQIVSSVPNIYLGDALTSYEFGMKATSQDNRYRLNVTAFRVNWRDIQSDQLRSTGLPITMNVGDGDNTGIEVEGDWRPHPAVTLHLAAQINDPRLRQPNAAFAADKNGGMPFIARESYSVSSDWTQTLWGLNFENSATLAYRGEAPLNYGALRTVRMDAYTNLDMSSFVNFGKLRIGARLNNATSVRSNSFAYGNPFSVEGSSQITPLRPRTLWLSVNHRF